MAGFVDVHSHMAPSGDDGVKSCEEGLELVREAAARGTAVQYATPHVNRAHPWTADRERRTLAAIDAMRPRAARFGLDLRLGYELSPERSLLGADLRRFCMESLDACLIELPLPHIGARDLDLLEGACERMERQGLRPILAHPERCELVWDQPGIVRDYVARGWLVQVNASSLLGRHGEAERRSGWKLLRAGLCHLIGSDGHRAARPPYLDAVHGAVAEALGERTASALLCGEALEPLRQAA